MDIRTNAGYIITDSAHIGDCEFVLGVSSENPQIFVTWESANSPNGQYYFSGNYFNDLYSAQKDLIRRCQREIERIDFNMNMVERSKKPKEKEQER